jgi:hypothetical protein
MSHGFSFAQAPVRTAQPASRRSTRLASVAPAPDVAHPEGQCKKRQRKEPPAPEPPPEDAVITFETADPPSRPRSPSESSSAMAANAEEGGTQPYP